MLDAYLNYLVSFITGLEIAAGLLGLVRYRRLPPSLRWLALLVCFDATMEITLWLLVNVFGFKNNLFMFPFIAAGEIVLQILLYRQVLQSAVFNRIVPWLLGFFCLYALLNSPLFSTVTTYVISLEILVALAQIGLAGLYFQKLLNELRVQHLYRDPFFWLSVALMTYSLANMMINLFSHYLLTYCTAQLQKIVFWGVRGGTNLILYLAYMLVLWARPAPANAGPAQLT
ncbi:MAG TPA: hypothetical protein VFO93_08145 [Hymenobacter sp.]|uniref:hypothetical protein n=1 Tax=Hymenobacter sp. TaxID=1898978 RepID=UPI002D7FDD8C|nr:hypothetical protein [Hymenobacter sp.]HET9503497.1 hypothetical protein [Hymenobacter sp.]